MIHQSFLIEDLNAADRECTRILDDLCSGIHALEAAPIPSSDAEGDLRGYTRMLRVFVMVFRVQFHTQRVLGLLRTGAQQDEKEGGADA